MLLVDGRRNTRRAWRAVLEATFPGCSVDEAPDGTAAWGRARTRPYDLVVADAALPDMRGLEFMDKARVALPDAVRVLLVGSGDGEDEAREATRRGRIHGAVPKDVPLADATAALRRLMPAGGA